MRRPISATILTLALVAASCGGDSSATITTTAPPSSAPTTTTSMPGEVDTPPPDLIDLTAIATATGSGTDHVDFPASAAIDGDPETWWTAASGPVQSLEIDFGGPVEVHVVLLRASQDPPGQTVHRLLDESGKVLYTFEGPTADLDLLLHVPDEPWELTRLTIETTESPSWVSWREVVIQGIVLGDTPPGADTVFVNAVVETIDEAMTTTDAVAVTDGEVVALGTDATALIGTRTEVIDLGGATLLPGIVDPHTHLMSDMGFSISEGQRVAFENGYTTLGDASVEPELLATYIAAGESDELQIRLFGYLGRTDYCGADLGTWYEQYQPGSEYGWFTVAGVKVFSDGGACGDLATSEAIIDGGAFGPPFHSLETLTEMIDTAAAAGYQVLVHAQGDLAIRDVFDAYSAVIDRGNELRHRIDHNAVVTDDLLPRYAESGLVAVLFASYPTCAEIPWTNHFTENGERWRDILDAYPGGHVAWHGDDPGVPPLHPIQDLFSYVTRAEVAEDGSVCEPPQWLAGNAITVDEALVMMTREAAYALHAEDEVGSIEVGKRADLIVLDANPRTVDLYDIAGITLLATVFDGEVVFCADQEWCAG